MKRLLTYLFLIIGLGLMINVSVNAEITLCKKNNFSLKDITTPVYLAEKNSCYTNSNKISIEEYVDILLDWNLKQKANIFWSKDLTTKLLKSIREEFIDNKLDTKYLDEQLVKKFSNISGVFTWGVGSKIISDGSNNTFSVDDVKSAIAKKEPTQTQQVAKEEASLVSKIKKWYLGKEQSQTQQVAKKNKTQTKKLNVIYKAYVLDRASILNFRDLAVLFLDKGKCKVSENVGSIFRNYKYKGEYATSCKWRYGGTHNEIINVAVGFGTATKNIKLQKDLHDKIYARILGKQQSFKVVKTDPNHIIRLAKKYNLDTDIIKKITKVAKKEKKKEKKVAKKESTQTQQVAKKEKKKEKKVAKKESTQTQQVAKKKKKLSTTLAKLTDTSQKKIIKKKITIDQDKLKVEKISEWEKSVLAAIEKEKNYQCELYDKKDVFKFDKDKKKFVYNKENIGKKINYCIKDSDILKLGTFKDPKYSKSFLDKIKGCKTNHCIRKNGGKKVYELFVKRGPRYHARYPGAMIEGMVWFELLYLDRLKKTQHALNKYKTRKNNNSKNIFKSNIESKIYSLIKMNRGRIKMRKALGFSLYDDTSQVITSQFLLAEFLNKDKLKVVRNIITPEIQKRKKLIEKYKSVLARYKTKLEEEKEKKNEKKS